MGTLSIRWMVKVLMYAAVVAALVTLNILWQPRPVQPLPPVVVGPEAVQPSLDQCRAGGSDVVEVHRCESGWAVFRRSRAPQVFDAVGVELCPAAELTDELASDCLRRVSDQVGRCSVACSASPSS